MDDDQKYYIALTSVVGTVLCFMTFMGLLYWQSVDKKILEGTKLGVHPIAMKCALDDSSYDGAICSQALRGK